MRLIGAIAAGELLETTELQDALVTLNQMLSSWNTEGASLVGRQRLQVSIGSTNSYPLPQRPVKIEAASASITGVDSALELVDSPGWEAIPVPEKQMQSIFIRKLYCDYLYPNATAYIWPTPRLSGTLELWVYAVMAQFGRAWPIPLIFPKATKPACALIWQSVSRPNTAAPSTRPSSQMRRTSKARLCS